LTAGFLLWRTGPSSPCSPYMTPDPAAGPGASISLETEVPEVLFDGMRQFIQANPNWDQYRLITSALASFLFQHGSKDACVNQHYLNGLFLR
jgi:Protein of unknown function (DUF2811).